MIDWQRPQVVRICYDVLGDVVSVTLGVFLWYLVNTFETIEWSLFMGELKFKPLVHVPYLAGRYFYLMACTTFVAVLHWYSPEDLDCQGAMVFMIMCGEFCIVASSMNMMSRLRAVWHDNTIITLIIIICTLGHIATAIIVPISIHVFWSEAEGMCQEVEHNNTNMFAFYLYTCIWDLVILILTIWGLRRERHALNSSFGLGLVYQGTFYIVCALIANTLVMVFTLKDLNIVMDIILTAPAGAVNVIVSSFMVTFFMPKDEDNVTDPSVALDAPSWLESDAKPDRSTASTIIDLTDAYFQRTSSDTQDGRYGCRTPQIRVQSPSSIEDDASSTCYSSE